MSQNASLHIAARSDDTALLYDRWGSQLHGIACGGSPTGQPTGPVLYGGRLTAVN
jgi:hypothetical protein